MTNPNRTDTSWKRLVTAETLTTERCVEPHMIHRCLSCEVDAVLRVNMETVDLWFEFGRIGSDTRRAYQHVWALSAVRSKTWDHYVALPETEEARHIAKVMGQRLPSGRGYA